MKYILFNQDTQEYLQNDGSWSDYYESSRNVRWGSDTTDLRIFPNKASLNKVLKTLDGKIVPVPVIAEYQAIELGNH